MPILLDHKPLHIYSFPFNHCGIFVLQVFNVHPEKEDALTVIPDFPQSLHHSSPDPTHAFLSVVQL